MKYRVLTYHATIMKAPVSYLVLCKRGRARAFVCCHFRSWLPLTPQTVPSKCTERLWTLKSTFINVFMCARLNVAARPLCYCARAVLEWRAENRPWPRLLGSGQTARLAGQPPCSYIIRTYLSTPSSRPDIVNYWNSLFSKWLVNFSYKT